MSTRCGWSRIEQEAEAALAEGRPFPLPAYSEWMPAPFVGIKPYAPRRADAPATSGAADDRSLDVTEYEQALELEPGLDHIASRLLAELGRLVRGEGHALSHTLLDDNPAWPTELAEAARRGVFRDAPLALVMPLALSRTQDDKGRVLWTLFGASHDGASAPFWRSFGGPGEVAATTRARFADLVAWAAGEPELALDSVRIVAEPHQVPEALRDRVLGREVPPATRAVFTLRPFAKLPEAVRCAHLAGELRVVPSPASLVFFEHRHYRRLARQLPRATQIPLLHLFSHVSGGYATRIPQSGWIEERDPATFRGGHRIVSRIARCHRGERVHRAEGGDGKFTDKVSVALFSTKPDDLGLYGKPMARNAELWHEDYELLLDGQRASREEIARASRVLDAGGRFGYRLYYPPMRAGGRSLYWHLPLVARLAAGSGRVERYTAPPLLGYVTAEVDGQAHPIVLEPRLLSRPVHDAAARLFPHETGRPRSTTTDNVHKILDMRELLGGPLSPSFARQLVHVAREMPLEAWLDSLPAHATDRAAAERLAAELRGVLGPAEEPGEGLTLEQTRTRGFEESVFRTIAFLAEGSFRAQENADPIPANAGKTGGQAALAAGLTGAGGRDLDHLSDHLHARYDALIDAHGMAGRAAVLDHVFRWETECDLGWSDGWRRNQQGEGAERNVVLRIPGRRSGEAVIMGDHYDTAYMEDVYEAGRGGDGLRAAAAGADDNHSATSALLHAADVLLPMAREGRLERDVWLVHLTGEEFPADCMGARALARALIERSLCLVSRAGERVDVSATRVVGAFILDMIGHNADHDRDVFQIAPGEGAASARLARAAHRANLRWNRAAAEWNRAEGRRGLGRALRMPDGSRLPPPFAHLPLKGEVRTEYDPRSALYNTDGQIFSDVGVPVVLFMENYDIRRTGYHDTFDTMQNIDLDYCAALTAIAIEAVALVACAAEV